MKPGRFGLKHVASVLWTEYWFTVICIYVSRGFYSMDSCRDTRSAFYTPRRLQLVITGWKTEEGELHVIVSSCANFNTIQRKDISCIRYVSKCFGNKPDIFRSRSAWFVEVTLSSERVRCQAAVPTRQFASCCCWCCDYCIPTTSLTVLVACCCLYWLQDVQYRGVRETRL